MSTYTMSADDGTITTAGNEMFQETLMEDLFNAEHFSEVDTCVEILSRPPPTPRKKEVGGSSRRNYIKSDSSNGNASRKSRSNRRPSNTGSHQRLVGGNRSSVQMQQMKEIDEDVDKLVREDVRKMIAKIRNSTQARPHIHDDKSVGTKSTEKKLVRPGKYGEVDLRSASAQARKELFLKHKQEKMKKRKTTDSDSRVGDASVTSVGECCEVRDQPEQRENQMSPTGDATRIKAGYYRNTQEGTPEQDNAAEAPKEKAGQSNTTLKVTLMHRLAYNTDKGVGAEAQAETPKQNMNQTRADISKGFGQDSLMEQANERGADQAKDVGESQVATTGGESNGPTGNDLSETHRTKEYIVSMPNIEKSSVADAFEPIECVLATSTDTENDGEGYYRDFLKKPDPSEDQTFPENQDVEEIVETETSPVEADEEKEGDLPGEKFQQAESKPDPSDAGGNVGVVQTDQGSKLPALARAEPPARCSMPIQLSLPRQATGEQLIEIEQGAEIGAITTNAGDMKQADKLTAVLQDSEDVTDASVKGADTTDDGTVELVLVTDSDRVRQLEYENAKLKDTLLFLQRTAVEKEKYFAELAWFGKRSEAEVKKWRPNFWRERLADLGPELFEEFRADAMRIADPDVGDWEHGFSSGSLAMARLLLGLSHAVEDEKICAFHDPDQPCTKHCVTCTVAEQRARELADFPVLDP